jgi:hypothetical protein
MEKLLFLIAFSAKVESGFAAENAVRMINPVKAPGFVLNCRV